MWFALYRRETHNDSSGFEHVFVGEEKDGKVTGFHNWIQFFLEERKGKLNYKGYILPKRRGRGAEDPDGDEHILTVQFDWGGESKSLSSTFMGVSPEFEVALYTLMFKAGYEENRITLAGFDIKLRCYRIHSRQGDKIGSCFPEVMH
tara:strand:+ start:1999 stop:2439 length:441 start_codon:yes stop_codon:yes gene_type:complete